MPSDGSIPGAGPDQTHGPGLAAAGWEPGVDATRESVARGTVRMKDHPDYQRVEQDLRDKGFEIEELTDRHKNPRVAVEDTYEQRQFAHRRLVVYVQPEMRWLDLQHELDHVRQVTERFPEGLMPTHVLGSRPKIQPPLLSRVPYDATLEYHVRLTEFNRLATEYLRLEREEQISIDLDVLQKHSSGVSSAETLFHEKVTRQRNAVSENAWARNHFPDIPELERLTNDLRDQLGLRTGEMPASTTKELWGIPRTGSRGLGSRKRAANRLRERMNPRNPRARGTACGRSSRSGPRWRSCRRVRTTTPTWCTHRWNRGTESTSVTCPGRRRRGWSTPLGRWYPTGGRSATSTRRWSNTFSTIPSGTRPTSTRSSRSTSPNAVASTGYTVH